MKYDWQKFEASMLKLDDLPAELLETLSGDGLYFLLEGVRQQDGLGGGCLQCWFLVRARVKFEL